MFPPLLQRLWNIRTNNNVVETNVVVTFISVREEIERAVSGHRHLIYRNLGLTA